MMGQNKKTATQTGTLFYTRMADGPGSFRVRFKSFHHLNLENRQRQAELEQMQSDYNMFKNGKTQSRKASLNALQKQPAVRLHKNPQERVKDGEELRIRLKSMRETRQNLFEQIKFLKQ